MSSEDLKFAVKELPLSQVVVYTDRAEIKRSAQCNVTVGGNEVNVYGFTTFCDPDSIRVEGYGNATISEVTFQEKQEIKKSDPEKVKDVQQQIQELNKKIQILEKEKSRVQMRIEILAGLAKQVKDGKTSAPATEANKHSDGLGLLSDDGINGITKFLDLYSDRMSHLDNEVFRIDEEISGIRDEITVLRQQLAGDYGNGSSVEVIRQVSILLDCKTDEEVSLTITYVTYGASWEPKYDIRAFSEDQVVKITYFGLIRQNTGEDWNDAKFFLSTARPSVGGDVPTLSSKTVGFEEPPMPVRFKSARMAAPEALSMNMAMAVSDAPRMLTAAGPPPPPAMAVAATEVKAGAMSTSYEIARKSTIPSDNTEHKVTVAMFDLKTSFEHTTVPQMVESVFLKAKLTNTSQYIILAGPTSIFVDNNFITKASIPTVSPAEEFECSLGVDAAVRVTYKPVQKVNERAGGFLSGKTTLVRYKQTIEVKNTHQHEVKIQVEDQLPRSTDDKIKVVLVAPTISKDHKGGAPGDEAPVALNDKNNVIWRSAIKAGATETFQLHYTIETPVDSRPIEFKQV